jgi:hypothetical protein
MWFAFAFDTSPMLPKTYWKDRNPENVAYVEGAYRNGSTRCPAREAVVVAEANDFGPEMVRAVNQEHIVT